MQIIRLHVSINPDESEIHLLTHKKSLDEDIVNEDISTAFTAVVPHMMKEMKGTFIGISEWSEFATEYLVNILGYIEVETINVSVDGGDIISNDSIHKPKSLSKYIDDPLIKKVSDHNDYCRHVAPSLDSYDFDKFKAPLKEDDLDEEI